VSGAATVGQGRLVLAIAVAIVLLVLLVFAIAARRRGRRRALALGAGPSSERIAGLAPDPTREPVAAEPYATLAADPGAAPAPSSERSPDAEGGPARGDDA
jgi:hypothetical protein